VDTRWYRGDYQDAFKETHEYYNLDVVAAPGGASENDDNGYEYEYEDDESR
jgi:hypothetical protein